MYPLRKQRTATGQSGGLILLASTGKHSRRMAATTKSQTGVVLALEARKLELHYKMLTCRVSNSGRCAIGVSVTVGLVLPTLKADLTRRSRLCSQNSSQVHYKPGQCRYRTCTYICTAGNGDGSNCDEPLVLPYTYALRYRAV